MTTAFFQKYAFISLGANLNSSIGSPEETIEQAILLLAKFSSAPLTISSLHKTQPVDCPPGSQPYINAVVGLLPTEIETPLSLLRRMQLIENSLGRKRSGIVNEARVIDLDLITFKNEQYESAELSLPHPRAIQRAFVLEPLRELVGNSVFPFQDRPIDELIAKIEK